jgi:hypothetical protein
MRSEGHTVVVQVMLLHSNIISQHLYLVKAVVEKLLNEIESQPVYTSKSYLNSSQSSVSRFKTFKDNNHAGAKNRVFEMNNEKKRL